MAAPASIIVRLEPRDRKLLECVRREIEKLRTTVQHAGAGSPDTIKAFNRCAESINDALSFATGQKRIEG